MLEASFQGLIIPKLEIELAAPSAEGWLVYLRYELTNVLITSFSVNGSSDDTPPTITVSNDYEQLHVTYFEYDENGKVESKTETTIKREG